MCVHVDSTSHSTHYNRHWYRSFSVLPYSGVFYLYGSDQHYGQDGAVSPETHIYPELPGRPGNYEFSKIECFVGHQRGFHASRQSVKMLWNTSKRGVWQPGRLRQPIYDHSRQMQNLFPESYLAMHVMYGRQNLRMKY